jgi:hypothetical protein
VKLDHEGGDCRVDRQEVAARLEPGRRRSRLVLPQLEPEGETTVTARTILATAAAAIAPLGLAACGTAGAVTQLGELKTFAATCPSHAHVAAYVAWDARRSLRGRRIAAARLDSLEKTAEKVAACGGVLRVVAFGATAASTVRLYDGELRPRGATENARLLRVPDLAARVRAHVKAALPSALAQLSGQGADPLSQFTAAEEFRRQLGPGYALHVVIATSGLARHVDTVTIPDLRGADVVVAGIGKGGRAAPTPTRDVEALRRFYGRVCERTRAHSCLVISDLAPLEG